MRGLVLTLVTVVGCGQGGSETCDQYVTCTAAFEPGLFTEASAAFGQDGSCWKDGAVDCDLLCEVGMDVLMEADSGAQCGSDASNPGLSEADFAEAFLDLWCDEYLSCSGEDCGVDPDDNPSDPECDYDPNAALDCLSGDWQCNHDIPGFSYPEPPAACFEVYSNCPPDDTDNTASTSPVSIGFASVECTGDDVRFYVETMGWTSEGGFFSQETGNGGIQWADEHDLLSYEWDVDGEWDHLERELNTNASLDSWVVNDSTVFTCPNHYDNSVMTYAAWVFDLDQNFADCMAWGDDVPGMKAGSYDRVADPSQSLTGCQEGVATQ